MLGGYLAQLVIDGHDVVHYASDNLPREVLKLLRIQYLRKIGAQLSGLGFNVTEKQHHRFGQRLELINVQFPPAKLFPLLVQRSGARRQIAGQGHGILDRIQRFISGLAGLFNHVIEPIHGVGDLFPLISETALSKLR